MKVAVLTQWLDNDANGLASGLGQALQRRGATVTFAAGADYADWCKPTSRQYLPKRDAVGGLPAIRYPYFRSHDRSPLKRLATYSTFAASTTAFGRRHLASADVILVNGTPATVALAAIRAKVRDGVPYVFLVPDVWPDSIYASGFLTQPYVRRLTEPPVSKFVSAAYEHAAAVIGISPGMRELLVGRGVPESKAHYMNNWANERVITAPMQVPARNPAEPLRLMYAGNLGFAQDLDNLLEAIDQLPTGMVSLTLVGTGAAETHLRAMVSERCMTSVDFRPPVPLGRLVRLMEDAHVHILSLSDEPLFRTTIPSKLQTMLAAGAPILCSAPGEVARLVRRHGIGLAARPGMAGELASAIAEFSRFTTSELVAMGNAARDLYLDEMSEEINGDRLFRAVAAAASDCT